MVLWRSMVGIGCLFCVGVSLDAAPGDLQLEILARTGDAESGPSGLAISKFETFPPGSNVPVVIDESGFISFAAEVQVNGDPEYGFYRALGPGNLSTLIQTDGLVPGLDTFDSNEPGNRRALQLGSSPRRGFSVNRDGSAHALILHSRFDGPFLYSVSGDTVGGEPVSWPVDISENRNFWMAVSISDGRGTTKQQSAGSSGDMVVSRNGTIFWKLNDAIIRASSRTDVRAVMFKDTPAPGFDEEEGAMLGIPLNFRGVDASNNAYFRAWVTKSSGDIDVLYRHNDADDSLSLLFESGKTPLPDEVGNEITATVEGDDIAVLEDGTVFIRGKMSGSLTGFWKREPGKDFELLRLISEFPGTETDQGTVGLRSVAVDFADWAVADDHSVFFTADVRFGASGINQEGIWKIDPEDNSIINLARAPLDGSFGDAPGTDATYGRIIQISAIGQGRVAFSAELSDGTEGLFATDINEGIVKIIKEGDELDGSVVQSFHFNTDTAGEDLNRTQGTQGLNEFGEVAFLATLENNNTVLVRASYEGEERARGNRYIWDEGIGGIDWHEVEDGKTNWVDASGIRWNAPPTLANAEVEIPAGSYAELTEAVTEIAELEVAGTFELFAALKVGGEMNLTGEVNQRNGSSLIGEGDVMVDGEILAWEHGIRTITTDPAHSITSRGMIDGIDTGIWAKADNGLTIDNEARVSADETFAIFAQTEGGDLNIHNKGDLASSNGFALLAESDSGAINIQSPPPGNPGVQLASTGHAIRATTAGDISVRFDGETQTTQGSTDALSINVETTGGSVDIDSRGSFSGTALLVEAGGVWARGIKDVSVKHSGSMNVNGWGILAESSDGDVMIDGRDIFMSSTVGGLEARAPKGGATIYSAGEMRVGIAPGIEASAGGDILIMNDSSIDTVGGITQTTAAGIWTETTAGSIVITNTKSISTFHQTFSPGIYAKATNDITVANSGFLSTGEGGGIWTETTAGTIDITHSFGNISADKGPGIWAKNSGGSVIIHGTNPDDEMGLGSGSFEHGINADARDSVSIVWNGDITTLAEGDAGIAGKSETAGVSITTRGDILSAGSDSPGVLLTGGTVLTLNILGGSVAGSDGIGAGVQFVDGTNNTLNNQGEVVSFNLLAVLGGTGNETIDNRGQIAGSIDLGAGANAFNNYGGSTLISDTTINLGAGNALENAGLLQLGEAGEAVMSTVLTGDYTQQVGGTLRVEVKDGTTADSINIIGTATLGGTLQVHLDPNFFPQGGETYEVLTAGSVNGTFTDLKVYVGFGPLLQSLLSRTIRFEASYEATKVILTAVKITIDDYNDWKDNFFDETDAGDPEVSDPDADPDGDFINNKAEFALGSDPLVPNAWPVSFMVDEGTNANERSLSAEFRWAKDATDCEWIFEWSMDMTTWAEAAVTESSRVDEGEFERIAVDFDAAVPVDPRVFVRLRVREKPAG